MKLRPAFRTPHFALRAPHWTRYTWGLLGVLGLGLALRLPLIWADPLDTPSGPQSATAAFVRRLAASHGDIKAGLPWLGPMPADLTGGLPVYAWLAALFTGLFGAGPIIGRVLTLLAALAATALLFVVVRRLAGGRAALYAAFFLTISPPGLYYGRAYLPDALGWATACAALAATLRWRDTLLAGRPHERRWFAAAAGISGFALLVAPANLGLLVPLAYMARPQARSGQPVEDWSRRAPFGKYTPVSFIAIAVAPLLLWTLLARVGGVQVEMEPAYAGGGLGTALRDLREGGFYELLLGSLVNGGLTFAGLLLLLAGIGRSVRRPWPWVLQLWALGGLLVLLWSGTRLAVDDSALAPWLPALAALVGIGANWLATLPAGIAAALRGQEDPELLDAEKAGGAPADDPSPEPWAGGARPAHGAVRRIGLQAAASSRQRMAWSQTRVALLRLGNTGAVLMMLAVLVGGWDALTQRYVVGAESARYAAAGRQAVATSPGKTAQRLVVVGPGAPEIFYTSGLTGWSVLEDRFSRSTLDGQKTAGATLLVSADPGWIGKQDDYRGLLVSFQPFLYSTPPPGLVMFDLLHAPISSDSTYFLETGHTLRGSFRSFWQNDGGVATLGYPLTEEIDATDPDDGKQRKMQYFQRALLEYHPEQAGTAFDVQPAPLGRWLVQAKEREDDAHGLPHIVNRAPVTPAPNTPTYRFFPQTGHSLRGEFLIAWQTRGGVTIFGLPISEEFNDVSLADGKVHIMQYFERARFEWHEEVQGKPQDRVQLGLVGAEWLARQR
ncbi:MAG: glycosyltransferase family 39 protein [Chloroflexia bacterium]